MASAPWTFGRVGLAVSAGGDGLTLPGHYPVQYAGDELKIEADLTAATAADMKVLRDQFRGYDLNSDERVIPVTSAADPSVDGFYRVQGVSVDDNVTTHIDGSLGSRVSVELLRVPGWQAPLFEVVAGGADRANVHSVAAQARSWVAGPGSLDSASLSVVTTTNATLTTADGSVEVWNHDGNLYSGNLTYQVDESGFYDGACRVEVDHVGDGSWRTVTGRQVENLVDRWRLSNGLVRVYPGGAEVAGGVLDLPGAAGDFCSTPDVEALDITNDGVELAVRVTLDDYTPAADQFLVGKWGAAGQRSYALYLQTDGRLRFSWTPNGTTIKSVVSGAPHTPLVNGQTYWLRLEASAIFALPGFSISTSDTDTLAAISSTSFSPSSPTGDSVASLAIHSGTAAATVGADAAGANPAAGTMRAAVIIDDPDGTATVVANPVFANAAQFVIAAANGTDGTGKVWTHQANAAIVSTGLAGGTVDDYAVDIYDPAVAEWQTKVYNITTGGATPTSLGVAKALTVNVNRPEVCSVRIHTNAVGSPFIDWTVRRGSTVVEGRVEHSHSAATNRAFGVWRKIVEAGTALASDEGIVATDNDADGHKYRIYSPDEITVATTNGGVHLTSAADALRFGIGSDARDASIASGQFYWAAQSHSQQIVAR